MLLFDDRTRYVLFDWGDTLTSESGSHDVPMADWAEVSAIEGARETSPLLARLYTLALCANATISRRPGIERALRRVEMLSFSSYIFCTPSSAGKRTSRNYGAPSCRGSARSRRKRR